MAVAKKKKVLTFAVCGYGGMFNMGHDHARDLHKTKRAKLVAVCDPDKARQKAAEEDFPGIQTFGSLTQLLKKSDAELIILITPHNTHAPLALQALRAKRHVIVEKPMCITTAEANTMIRTAKANKRMLSVYHNRRWDGDYVALKKIVRSGVIGDVFSIRCHMGGYGMKTDWWRASKKISGGCLYDWGAHMCDWVLGLTDAKIASVTGFSQKRMWMGGTNEDEARVLIRFKDGAVADVMVSQLQITDEAFWRVCGTKGQVKSTDDGFQVMTYGKNDKHKVKKVPMAKTVWAAYYKNIIGHLLDGEKLIVTPESAARAIAIIDGQGKSARTGKEVKIIDK
jgi:scyllo-inositol 2-dehydrogenase (NADP+)